MSIYFLNFFKFIIGVFSTYEMKKSTKNLALLYEV